MAVEMEPIVGEFVAQDYVHGLSSVLLVLVLRFAKIAQLEESPRMKQSQLRFSWILSSLKTRCSKPVA